MYIMPKGESSSDLYVQLASLCGNLCRRAEESRFRVQVLGFRVQGSNFGPGVQGLGG